MRGVETDRQHFKSICHWDIYGLHDKKSKTDFKINSVGGGGGLGDDIDDKRLSVS